VKDISNRQDDRYDAKTVNENEIEEYNIIGNSLILILEEIIQLLGCAGGTWGIYTGSSPQSKNKESYTDEIRKKANRTKELFRDFQHHLKQYNQYDINDLKLGIDAFLNLGDYHMDALVSEWILGDNIDKAIDDAHNMCSKIRELLRKINKTQ
jgi:hypothetical protein